MRIELTEEQQRPLGTLHGTPPRVIDPRGNAAFVLLREEEYESVRATLGEEKRQKAIRAVGLRNAVGRMNEGP
jgi:hypothetical protein